jgi:predicted deacylase
MVPGDAPPRDAGPAGSPTEVIADDDGLFRTSLSVGDTVNAGDEIGAIYSEFGQRRGLLQAPHAGEIWALRAMATTRAGDYLAWVTE